MHFLSARQARCGEPMSFETLPLSSIRDNPNNAREHSRKQLATELCGRLGDEVDQAAW